MLSLIDKINFYSGIEYKNNLWSYDHIIPTAIGGAEKFKIISCYRCNIKISKDIEQKAIMCPIIDFEIKDALRDGYMIRMRRKKYRINLVKTLHKTSFGIPVKLGYNLVTKTNTMQFVGREAKNLNIDSLKEFEIHLQGDNISKNDKIIFSALQYKILIGACAWIFGIGVYKSQFLSRLREIMWNKNPKDIFNCWCSNKYEVSLVWHWKDNQYKIRTITLENKPHHTISIRKKNGHLHANINLFGSLEVAACLGEVHLQDSIKINEEFNVVLIVKTDSNEVLQMSKNEYRRYKIENKSYKEEIKSLHELESEEY